MTATVVELHPVTPQQRRIDQVVNSLRQGAVMAYPTDTSYALGCCIGFKKAEDKIRQIRQLPQGHLFTIACHDLSSLGTYAKVDNSSFRLLKRLTPGPFTFVLPATKEVPKRLKHEKRKTIGLRVPDHKVTLAILAALGEPLITTTLIMPGDNEPLIDSEFIKARLTQVLDIIVEGGVIVPEPTTVVDLLNSEPHILRQGKGIL